MAQLHTATVHRAVTGRRADRRGDTRSGGARALLRPAGQAAILATRARGMLSRGLGVERADRLVTNVSPDHFGETHPRLDGLAPVSCRGGAIAAYGTGCHAKRPRRTRSRTARCLVRRRRRPSAASPARAEGRASCGVVGGPAAAVRGTARKNSERVRHAADPRLAGHHNVRTAQARPAVSTWASRRDHLHRVARFGRAHAKTGTRTRWSGGGSGWATRTQSRRPRNAALCARTWRAGRLHCCGAGRQPQRRRPRELAAPTRPFARSGSPSGQGRGYMRGRASGTVPGGCEPPCWPADAADAISDDWKGRRRPPDPGDAAQ